MLRLLRQAFGENPLARLKANETLLLISFIHRNGEGVENGITTLKQYPAEIPE